MTLRIDNRTNYRTEDLRVLIAEALERDGLGSRGVRVEVRRARQSTRVTGYAWYHSRRMVLRVPDGETISSGTRTKRVPWLVMPEKIRDDLAAVTMHEAAHCRGVRHKDMHDARHWCHSGHEDVRWASAYQIRAVPPPEPKPKENLVAKRAAHVAKQLARAERRLKLARTIAAKWRRKAAYYAKKAAASETKP